jgi:ribose-phosphate pyrophosphokinase
MPNIKLFSGNSHIEFARKISTIMGVELHLPDESDARGPQIKWFKNGNVMVDLKKAVRDSICFVLQTQAPPVSDNIIELLWMIGTLKSAGAKKVIAVIPYLPYSRSDKKDHHRSSLGAKFMALHLIAAGVDGILIMDPHFAQIHSCFEPDVKLDVLEAKPFFLRDIRQQCNLAEWIVGAPDINEAKHCGPVATELGLDIAIIDKRRKDDSEKAKSERMIGTVEGKKVLLFDDEVASGGTLVEAANFFATFGALGVSANITHPVLSDPAGVVAIQACSHIIELVVTDTIPVSEETRRMIPKLRILSVAEMFAQAMQIMTNGGSLGLYKDRLKVV